MPSIWVFGLPVCGVVNLLNDGEISPVPLERRHPLAGGNVVEGRKDRDALVEEGLDGADARVGVEMAPDGIVVEKVVQRQEAHPLVVTHERADDHPAAAFGDSPER